LISPPPLKPKEKEIPMSTTTRKARKRSGEKFQHPTKTPTPLMQRAWFADDVRGPAGTKFSARMQPRSEKKIARALKARGVEAE